MRTTIDGAGRIVVPKALRDAVGLTAGQAIEVSARDGKLEIEVAPTPMHLESRSGHLVAVPELELPELTAEMVRATLDQVRR
jgi:AbrB family looped-hinge helix DNA binding protein